MRIRLGSNLRQYKVFWQRTRSSREVECVGVLRVRVDTLNAKSMMETLFLVQKAAKCHGYVIGGTPWQETPAVESFRIVHRLANEQHLQLFFGVA